MEGNGGPGGYSRTRGEATYGSGGVVATSNPTRGVDPATIGKGVASNGPGGGAACKTGTAQTGAAGYRGAGGGGGGASLNGYPSGAGGAGGPGYALITAHFS